MLVVLMVYAARYATATLIVIAAAFVTAEFALSAAEMTACAPQIKVASIISAVVSERKGIWRIYSINKLFNLS